MFIYDTTIIGAGTYGTALAIVLAKNGHNVLLWGRNNNYMHTLKVTRCNQIYLPNIYFPTSLSVESSLEIALSSSNNIIIAVPSNEITNILLKIKPHLNFNAKITLATKGLEKNTGRFLHTVVQEILGHNISVAIISGPTFAKELAIGLPTAIVIASKDNYLAIHLKKLLNNKNFLIYVESDLISIQIAGAIKNVIAIAAGISDGIGLGSNARTALITCGFSEIFYLGLAMGGKSSVLMGMAGIGDLLLTCTDNTSRNRKFGFLLGQGLKIQDAIKKIGQTIEGFNTAKEAYTLSKKYKVHMPIIEQIYKILYHNRNVHKAVEHLIKLQCNIQKKL